MSGFKVERCGHHAWQDDAYIVTMNGYSATLLKEALARTMKYHQQRAKASDTVGTVRSHTARAADFKRLRDLIREQS